MQPGPRLAEALRRHPDALARRAREGPPDGAPPGPRPRREGPEPMVSRRVYHPRPHPAYRRH
eukprot:7240452-Lingulodinium_polyedra.AAC.1